LADALAASPRDDAGALEGGAYLAGATAGLALATYGVATYLLVQQSPFRAPLDVPR
jgi:hypothetical protein